MAFERVNEASLTEFHAVLMEKLPQRYGHRTIIELMSWLRVCIQSNEYFFIRNENSIGLAWRRMELMAIRPVIEEIFVLAKSPEHIDDCEEIYRAMYQWGKMSNAKDFLLENLTDFSKEKLKTTFGALRKLEIPYVRIT